VETYLNWCLAEGYAVPSVNLRLSTIRVYARLAGKAGYMPGEEIREINALRSYGYGEARRVNEKRVQQRLGKKKAEPTLITDALATALIDQRPDTAQGRRDQLLMCILLHHGLRVSEARLLTVESFDLQNGTFTFYRPKVHKTQTHRMTKATLAAAKAFLFGAEAPRSGPIFSESNKNGTLDKNKRGDVAISERGLNKRVASLGSAVGIENLSPHDCRHYWATSAARRKTPIDRLKQAGGWNSVAMPMHYIAEAEIANEGLDPDDEYTETTGGSKPKQH
jgi:integrase